MTQAPSMADVGRWLRRARETRGLSQQQVADELRLARPTVSHMESGQRGISSIELMHLARLYGRRIEYFLRPWSENEISLHVEPNVRVVFRAETEMLASDESSAVLDDILTRSREYAELERLLERRQPLVAPDYRAMLVGRRMVPWREGSWVAERERHRLHLGADPSGDLFGLLEREGVKVIFADLREDVSGGYFSTDETGPCIFLNRSQVLPRVRFTAAHEFAHVLFDRDEQPSLVDRAVPMAKGSASEQRANAFAAAFLMPELGVRGYLDELGIEPSRLTGLALLGLSEHFGTSYPATLYRLQSLGLIDRQRRLELEEDRSTPMRVHGGRVLLTPAPDVPHCSHRFVMLALLAYDREYVSLARLVELLGVDREAVVELIKFHGMRLRQGPIDRDEAVSEVHAIRAIRQD